MIIGMYKFGVRLIKQFMEISNCCMSECKVKERIFIIEDDFITIQYIRSILSEFDFEIAGVADNSIDAYTRIEETRPDLILIDISLSDSVSGIDIAKELDKQYNIPVIYITSHKDVDIIQSTRSTNPYGYLIKPIDPIILYSTIYLALNQIKIKEERDSAQTDYQRIFDLSLDMICISNKKDYFIKVNPAAEDILGYPEHELLNKPYTEFIHPDDHKKTIDAVKFMFSENKPVKPFVNRYLQKDGKCRWIEWTSKPVADEGVIYSVARNITEQKRNEEKLKLNEDRLSALLKLNEMSDQPLDSITDFVLEVSIDLTRSEIGYLAFLNEDETILTMYSWSKTAMKTCKLSSKPKKYEVKETGLWGEAVRQRQPVITNDYQKPNPLKKGYPSGHVAIKRHMNIPVFDKDKIVIVAGVGNKTGPYDDSDVFQLSLLMDGLWKIIQRRNADEAIQNSGIKNYRINWFN